MRDFTNDFWGSMCSAILSENNAANNDKERRKARRAEKLWRRDTFKAYYRLKFHAKRKTVQRVVRKDLSSGLFCRHTAEDNFFNPGFQPKMSGFSVRSALGDVINIDAELPSVMETTTVERYDSLRIGEENRPTRRENRHKISRKIWRNGAVDFVDDIQTEIQWRERIVKVAAFSNSVNFDYTMTDETENVGEITRKEFREKSCERWIEPRLDSEGELLPQNSLASCDDGRKIPDLDLANWKLASDGYVLDSVPRYVVKSVLSAFRLNIVGGNAANNGGLRPCYNGKQRSDIRHEFIQECLQEIAVAHLECLRCVKRFTGILNSALSQIITRFVRHYCAGGNNRDRSATIERTKRNANALAQKLAQFSGLQFQSETDEKILKSVMAGHTQTETAEMAGMSQQRVSKIIKETIALNRVLAQLELDAQ